MGQSLRITQYQVCFCRFLSNLSFTGARLKVEEEVVVEVEVEVEMEVEVEVEVVEEKAR